MYDNIIKLYELEHIRNKIEKIESIIQNNEVNLIIVLKREFEQCKYCLSNEVNVNDYVKVKITHSITVTRKVYIIHKKRRYKCKLCNKTFYEFDPFTDHNHRLSKLTIMNILDYLKDPNHSFKSAANMFNTTSNTIIKVFDEYVNPIRRKLPKVLCIDEIHMKTGSKYPYACVLLDFHENKIVDVLLSRRKYFLKRYFERIGIKELDNVEYVVMDLWSPYRDVISKYMPKAKIVADAFHVVTNINRILDEKRRQVMNKYIIKNKELYENNKDIPYIYDYGYLLKKFAWMINVNPKKIKGRYIYIKKHRFSKYSTELLKHILNSDDELKEIYNLRNMYQRFNEDNNLESAKENLALLINNFINHEIKEIRVYGKTLALWFNEIVNSFTKHKGVRYNNGRLESRNRQIKTIKRNGYGYTNFRRFRARVMYSINKDVPLRLK